MTAAQKTLFYIAENMHMQKTISEEGYQHFQRAIELLGLIPDNATNGDVVKALFPNALYSHGDYTDKFVSFGVGVTLKDSFGKWWNTPYKREGE